MKKTSQGIERRTRGRGIIVGSDVADVIIGGAGKVANDSEWRVAA